MPSLSQSLSFIVNSTSTVILNYPNTGTTALEYSSVPIKGDGYFGGSDGFHTVQVDLTEFIGTIELQGTLTSQPEESDWSAAHLNLGSSCVDTTGAIIEDTTSILSYTAATTIVKVYNFIGNYTWVRAKVSNWTEGTVNGIKVNH
jgi:hypothetical protein